MLIIPHYVPIDKRAKKVNPVFILMCNNNRQMPRFNDFARAKINGLCQLPGILEDVSKTGCKVRFPHSFEIDTDVEYTLTILPALRSGIKEFELVVRPEWVCGKDDSFLIGFCILHSPGMRQYQKYVEILAQLDLQILQEA